MSVSSMLRPIVTIDSFKLTFYRVGTLNASAPLSSIDNNGPLVIGPSGTFVTRPERREVEFGAGELVAVLSEVSMRGVREDGITFGVADGRGFVGLGGESVEQAGN